MKMLPYSGDDIVRCVYGLLAAVLLRLCTALHPHSGQGKAPMYGDYEAQRHWMEVTVNLPMNQWYHNSTLNDLEYWGLDYPPLTAYHSYVFGLIAYLINPQYVSLFKSRGYESDEHKLFMRTTVLIADICVYLPALMAFFLLTKDIYKNECVMKKGKKAQRITDEFPICSSLLIALLYPGLILIDHGHFQYNCISLGLMIFGTTCLCLKFDALGSIFFCLALNYKQMELYHAFPFFFYLLSACIPKPGEHSLVGVAKLSKIGLSVLVTFGILWLPFLFNSKDFFQVVHRLFPLARGVFEDKVANVWCSLNVFYKFKSYCSLQMVRYCTVATLTAVLPSSADLFLRPNIKKFIPALINSSLAFFLFSFQVHEKSILLAAIPVLLYIQQDPLVCFWFLSITTFSMLPLFIKDGLITAYIALTVFYIVAFIFCHERWGFETKSNQINTFQNFYKELSNILHTNKSSLFENRLILKKLFLYLIILASFTGCLVLTVTILLFKPPSRYPDLYPLAISAYSCVHFLGFFLYFNIIQFRIPQIFEEVHIKLKES